MNLEECLKNNFGKEIPEDKKEEFKQYLRDEGKDHIENIQGYGKDAIITIIPSPINNSDKILTWMIYWPWSLLISLVSDLISEIFRKIGKLLIKMMEQISANIYKNTNKDF